MVDVERVKTLQQATPLKGNVWRKALGNIRKNRNFYIECR